MKKHQVILAIPIAVWLAGCATPVSHPRSALGVPQCVEASPSAAKPRDSSGYVQPSKPKPQPATKLHASKPVAKIATAKKPVKFEEPAGTASAANTKSRFEEPVDGDSPKKKPAFDEPAETGALKNKPAFQEPPDNK